jgi:hypothetical protein
MYGISMLQIVVIVMAAEQACDEMCVCVCLRAPLVVELEATGTANYN